MTVPVLVDAIGFDRYGEPEVLHRLRASVAAPGRGQVRVRVAAAAVNPADTYLRSGRFRFVLRVRLPFVPGLDVAGVVEEVGPGTTRVSTGDTVYAALPARAGGAYAERVVVSQKLVAPAPQALSLGEAAALPVVSLTALQGLRDHAGLRPGDSVLVWGASGGVGTVTVQIAAALGARVTAVTRSSAVSVLQDLGSTDVINRDTDLSGLAGRRFDVVFDASGTLSVKALRRLTEPAGNAVTVDPGRGNPVVRALTGVVPGPRVRGFLMTPSGTDLELIRRWVDGGTLRPVVSEQLAVADAVRAHRLVESRLTVGKVVLVVDRQLAHSHPDGPL